MSDVPPPPPGPPAPPPPPPGGQPFGGQPFGGQPPAGGSPIPPPPPANLTPPPGYVAFQGAPTPTGTLRRVNGLRTAVIVLSIVTAVGTLLATLLTRTVTNAADDFLAGNISEDDFLAEYAPVLIGQSIQGVGQLALVIVSIVWLYRVAKNVRLFGRRTTWAPLWAVFGWLLPPILFVIPFLMVREMWKASDPDSPAGSDTWKRSGESTTVIVWFLLYGVLSAVLSVLQASTLFSQGFGNDAGDIAETVSDAGNIAVASGVVVTLAAIAWALAVRDITARHVRLTGER